MNNANTKVRMIQYDLLRIIAAFSVVWLHTASQFWYVLDIYSKNWIIANSYDAVSRFGVPIFVMISGALFLDHSYTLNIKYLYRHNIFRMIILYITWSFIYGLYDCIVIGWDVFDLKDILRQFLYGRYHLWFIPMIVGIYVLLPVLKSWTENTDKKNLQYFLWLFLIFQIGCGTLRAFTVTDELHYILDLVKIEMVSSYIGYFIWGFYLSQYKISSRIKRLIYFSAVVSAVLNVVFGNILSWRAGEPTASVYDSFGVFTFMIVSALFLAAFDICDHYSFGNTSCTVIREISSNTLGVYLMHIGLIEELERHGIHTMMVPIAIGIPLMSVLIFTICIIITAFIRRIPIIGRYLC